MGEQEQRRWEAGAVVVVVALGGPIAPADIPGLCERARALLEGSGAGLLVCDVAALANPDAAAVDALARLQLTAGRLGCRVRLRHAGGRLRQLLALMGLAGVLQPEGASALEPGGQPEQREQPLGVEEEADPADPAG